VLLQQACAGTRRALDSGLIRLGAQKMNPRVILQTMIALASASLGLVAALAWNEAIKATLARLGLGDSLAGLYTYAILATLIAVTVLLMLGRVGSRIGGDVVITREAD
jgi:hypothetical protein